MESNQLSPRFRVLRWLHRPSGDVGLAEVRDAATGAIRWALFAESRREPGFAVALHHRALQMRPLLLAGELDSLQLIEIDEGTLALFEPIEGEPWATSDASVGEQESARRIADLTSTCAQWRASGLVFGRVQTEALWWTAEGTRLLPTAWLLPLEPAPGHTHAEFHDPMAVQRELTALYERLDDTGAASMVSTRAEGPTCDAELADALDAACAAGGWLVVRSTAPSAVARQTETWARTRAMDCARVQEFAVVRSVRRVNPAPVVLVLEDVRSYAAVAEALAALQRASWLDGNEMLVITLREELADEALRLYAARRFGSDARHDFTHVLAPAAAAELTIPDDPVARQVLDFVDAAGRSLSAQVLARATGLAPPTLAHALWVLHSAHRVELVHGHHIESGGVQLLVRRVPRDRDCESVDEANRRKELRILLASSLDTQPRPTLALQWLRAEAASVLSGTDTDRRWRELAVRAQARGRDLLAFAAWSRLLDHEGATEAVSREDRVSAAICLSDQYQLGGQIDRASEILLETLEAGSADEADRALEADLVIRMAQLEIHRSDYAAAEQRLSALLANSKGQLGVEPRGRAYVELGWVQHFLGRTRESIRNHELALRVLDPLSHADLIARVHNSIGFALYKESDYTGSIVHYERAIRLREQLGDELGVARSYNNLALSQRALGQLQEAERSLVESLRRKRAAGDELSYAASLLNLGFVQLDRADTIAAEQSAERCLEIALARQHPETEAEAWGLRGEVALAQNEPELALDYLQRDLEICEATEHQSERLATLRRLAEVLLRLDRDEDAAAHLASARELLLHQPSRYETAMIDSIDATLQVRARSAAAAVELFGAAARGLGLVGRPAAQVEALARRGLIESELGRVDRARATFAEVKELVGRNELHEVPEAVNALERILHRHPAAPGPLPADGCLDVLVEALAATGEGPEAVGHVVGAVATALASVAAVWIGQDRTAQKWAGDRWELAPPPTDLSTLDSGTVAEIQRSGDWTAVTLPAAEGWLALQRSTPLQPPEEQLLRGVARAWLRPEAVEVFQGVDPVADPAERRADPPQSHGLIGRSEALRDILHMIKRVAATDVGVLILGENGTGKELVAQAIHRSSARCRSRFIAINCASIPGTLLESELFGHERGAFTSAHARRLGRFELAHGGTLMLDEIGEMPLEMQAKILRVLQERTFTRLGGSELVRSDARIIAATNRDLDRELERGRFRADLYFRLNVVTIRVPPLRERPEDIEPLAQHFLRRHGPEYGVRIRDLSPDALAALTAYSWPGNVRELENALKHALVFASGDLLRAEDLPASVLGSGAGPRNRDLEHAVQAVLDCEDFSEERPLLQRLELHLAHAMVRRVGNKTLAARLLGVTKPTLYNRLRRFEALYGNEAES